MPEDPTKKSLRYSIYDGAAFAVMDGMTASFLTPFAVALNASVSLIAALSYVPQLVGAFTQLFAAKVVELAKILSREVLLGRAVGMIQYPLSGLVNVLQGNIRNLVLTLKAVESRK